jgi:hypothetical protein
LPASLLANDNPSFSRRVISWGVLTGTILAVAGSTVSHGLLWQPLWQPRGLERLEWLSAAWTAWCLIVVGLAPGWFVPATVTVIALFLLAAAGPGPVLTVALFLLSCRVVGSVVLPVKPRRTGSGSLTRGIVQIATGAAVWMAFFSLAAHFPVNYAAVYLLLLAAPLIARPRVGLRWLLDAVTVRLERRSEYLFLALAAFPLLCHLLIELRPEMGADALAVHLTIPAWVASHHVWPFDYRHLTWAVMPLGADWLYTAVYLPEGEYASRLLNFAFCCTVVLAVYAASRRFLEREAAMAIAALMASTPLTQLVTGSLFSENVQAAMLVGALLAVERFHAEGELPMLYAAMILLGTSLAAKYGSVTLAIPMLLLLSLEMRRQRTSRWTGALAALQFLAFGSIPYVYAWIRTGNPLYPYMNQIFKAPGIPSAAPLGNGYQFPLSFALPWRMLFETHFYNEGRDGGLGLHLPILFALIAVSMRRRWPWMGWAALSLGLASCLLTFQNTAYVRYAYAALPMLCIAGAAALGLLRPQRALFRTGLAALALVVPFNVFLMPASGWYFGNFFLNPFDPREAEEAIKAGNPARRIVGWLNQKHPGEPVGFFDCGDIAGLNAKAYTTGWHTNEYALQVESVDSPETYGLIAREHGIRNFVVPVRWSQESDDDGPREFLRLYTVPEYSFGLMELRRATPDASTVLAQTRRPPRHVTLCEPSLVDDYSRRIRYSGEWRRVGHFGGACNGTLTFTDAAGAEATIDFAGTRATLVFAEASNEGMAEVFIDGASQGVIDLYSPCQTQSAGCTGVVWHSVATYEGLKPGAHSVTVRVLHARNPRSTAYGVDIDGFIFK